MQFRSANEATLRSRASDLTTNRWGTASDTLLLAVMLLAVSAYWLTLGPDRDAAGQVRDASLYAYVGRVVAAGGLPYLDAWDNKGPLLHLFHALAALAGGASARVFVTLLLSLLFLSSLFLHLELSRLTSRAASLLALCLGFAAMSWLSQFGLVEPLACVFLILALASFLAWSRSPSQWLPVVIGCCAGALALLRVDLIAVPCLLGLAILLMAPWREKPLILAGLVGGSLAVVLPVIGWLWSHGALMAMFDQYIGYNSFHHIDRPLGTRVLSAASLVMTFLLDAALGVFALVGWVLLAHRGVLLAGDRTGGAHSAQWSESRTRDSWVAWTIVLIFVVDFALTFTSGREYKHYVARLVPLGVVLSAFTFQALWRGSESRKPASNLVVAAISAIFVVTAIGPHTRVLLRMGSVPTATQLITHIKENLGDGGTIYVYGADGWVYNDVGVMAPTKYGYLYPLVTKGYTTPEMVAEETRRLRDNPPSLIIDMPNPRLTPLDKEGRTEDLESNYVPDTLVLREMREWIRTNYQPDRAFKIPDGTATVWRRKD